MSDGGNTPDLAQATRFFRPHVTSEVIEAAITKADYHVFPGTNLIVCCLTLRNGQPVTGEYVDLSGAPFNPALGRQLARDNARDKVWALEAYAARNQPQED